MLRSEFKSQFHSQPYFYLSNLFYISQYNHFTPLMSFFAFPTTFLCTFLLFPGPSKCDHIVHFSTLFGFVIRDNFSPENLQSIGIDFILFCYHGPSTCISGGKKS